MALTFRVVGHPVAWSRVRLDSRRGMRWFNKPELTAWQEQVAAAAVMAIRTTEPHWRFADAYTVTATFYMPIPQSWSKKKQAALLGKPHNQKPDVDNLLKAVLEVMSKPDGDKPRAWIMEDDAQIVTATVSKVWAHPEDAGVEVEVRC